MLTGVDYEQIFTNVVLSPFNKQILSKNLHFISAMLRQITDIFISV